MLPCSPPLSPGQHFDFLSPRSSRCGRVGGGCSREPARAHFFQFRLPFSRGSRWVHKESITRLPGGILNWSLAHSSFVWQARPTCHFSFPLPAVRLFNLLLRQLSTRFGKNTRIFAFASSQTPHLCYHYHRRAAHFNTSGWIVSVQQ